MDILHFCLLFQLVWMSTANDDIQSVLLKMEKMERKIETLEAKVTEQGIVLANQDVTIKDLNRKLTDHFDTTIDLRNRLHRQNVDIIRQNRRQSALESIIKSPKFNPQLLTPEQLDDLKEEQDPHDPTQLNDNNKTKTSKTETMKTKTSHRPTQRRNLDHTAGIVNRRSALAAEEVVAFTATLTNTLHHVTTGQSIPFDKVLLNRGNGYHNAHGLFIVPTTGIYVISASLTSSGIDPHNRVDGLIEHDGVAVASIYAAGVNRERGQGSQTVVLEANQGDEIWVKSVDTSDTDVMGGQFSSFSGYLLLPL